MDTITLQAAADKLGCDLPAVQAIAEVESSGVSFWTIGGVQRPPLRLEAHWFSALTHHVYDVAFPGISSPTWNPNLAAPTYEGAWAQFEMASSLDRKAAIGACSWGAFQVMGYNWQRLHYASLEEFFAIVQTEAGQLEAFVRYISTDAALKASLQLHAWQDVARRYNGDGQVEYYANRLEQAFYNHGGRG